MLAPWARSDDPEHALRAAQEAADETGGHRFGLDLDLTVEAPPRSESALAPLELSLDEPAVAPEPADPFLTGAAPLSEDIDPFSQAVASERIRRR
jgi:hypothetical protein